MAMSPGEKKWSWLYNMIRGGPPYVTRFTPGHIYVTFEVRIGPWIKFRSRRFDLEELEDKPQNLIFPSPSILKVKIYAIVEKYFTNDSVSIDWDLTNVHFDHFLYWMRVPWPYSWSPTQSGYEVTLDRRFNIASLELEPKTARVLAEYRRRSKLSYLGDPSSRGKWPKRPNPEVKNSSAAIAIEDTYTPYTQTGTRWTESYRKSYSSVNTPRFASLKPSELPVNPYNSRTVITYDSQACNTSVGDYGGFSRQWDSTTGMYPGIIGPLAEQSFDSATYNKTLRKLIDRAGNSIAANLAQDTAQIGQMVNLVGNTADRIRRSIRQLRSGNILSASNELLTGRSESRKHFKRVGMPSKTKTLAQNWLELQYAWKPLLMDVEGSLNSLSTYFARSVNIIHQVSATGRRTSEARSTISEPLYGYAMGYRKYSHLWRCRIGVRYSVESPLKSFFAQTGFTNPLNLAWEVLPYSFVIDWFLPIGPFLETLSAWHGLAFSDGWVTQFYNGHAQAILNARNCRVPPFYDIAYSHAGWFDREVFDMNRQKLTSFPSARFPTLKSPVSTTHALNAIALMRTAFRDRR